MYRHLTHLSHGLRLLPRLVAVFVVLTGTLVAMTPAPATAAQKTVDPCKLVIDPLAQKICEAGKSTGEHVVKHEPIVPTPVNIATSVAGAAGQQFLQIIAQAEASTVSKALQDTVKNVNDTGVPTLNRHWFQTLYLMLFALAFYVAIVMFFVRGGTAAKDRDPGEAFKAFVGFAVFIVAAVNLPVIVGGAVKVCDGPVSNDFLSAVQGDLDKSIHQLVQSLLNVGDFQDAVFFPLLVLLGGVVGGILMQLEFFVREAALYVFTLAEVLALAMNISGKWGYDRLWRCTFGLIGLVLFKVIAGVMLFVAVEMLGDPGKGDPVVYGSVMLILMPFLTWRAYKFISGHDPQPGRLISRAYLMVQAAG